MFCFEGGFIHVEQPIRSVRTRQQLRAQGPPAWLHSFLESEEYLLKCPSNCFSGKMKQDLGDRLQRSHRKRYFCTECPEEGAICLGRIIDGHLRHPILKVRKVKGVEGPVIKVGDIEPVLNISYVARHFSPNDDLAFVKLKTRRQAVWGAGCKQDVPCFNCLQVASTDPNQKYCSIKCAYLNTVEAVDDQWTSIAEDLNLQPRSTSSIEPNSCRITSSGPMHGRNLAAAGPEIQPHHPAPPKSTPAPLQSRSGHQRRQPSKGWFSRFRYFLHFGSSRRTASRTEIVQHIQLSEDINFPSTGSGPDCWITRSNFAGTQHVKESEGEQRGSHGQDPTPDRALPSRVPSRSRIRTTEDTTLQPRDNEKVIDRHRKSFGSSNGGGPRTRAQDLQHSCISKSTTAVPRPSASRVTMNGLNVKAGAVTNIAWRSEEDPGDKDELQRRWEDVRNRVLNNVGWGISTSNPRTNQKKNREPTS